MFLRNPPLALSPRHGGGHIADAGRGGEGSFVHAIAEGRGCGEVVGMAVGMEDGEREGGPRYLVVGSKCSQ